MIICSDDFFERLENGALSVVEKRRYHICQMAQSAMEEVPVFYFAQPQGVKAPAIFVRIAGMRYHKRLGREVEGELTFELRYLAESSHDDSECEQAMEKLLDVFGEDSFDKEAVTAERTETGVTVKVISGLRWRVEREDEAGELMRLLEMTTTDQ